MIQMEMFAGGAGGGQPGAVGAFQYISYINQAMRNMQQAIADNSENGILMRSVAAGTLMLRDIVAYQYSPFLTGTLRAAHRSEVIMEGDSEAVGYIYIDPDVVNPVYGTFPAIYGMEVREKNDWPEEAVAASGQMILDTMSKAMIGSIIEISGVF